MATQADDPQPEATGDDKATGLAASLKAIPPSRLLFYGAIVAAGLLVSMGLCALPGQAQKFQPPPPVTQVVVTEVAPTTTVLPTWTPVPTATPPPLVDLPLQQRAYQEYRIYHLLYEYRACYRHHTQPPPTPVPTPTAGPTPEYTGHNPQEPWRDDPRFAHLEPTPHPTPTPIPGALVQHLPPPYGLSDREVDDHALGDLSGATRWLIERYSRGDCVESTHYAAFEGRTVFLSKYATR
ncbi:MAG: hypothetical protein OXF79_22395 [Chloroflexi bacterium]|nr:hypothetical protein [Chloroflexota bacterium]